MVEVEWLPFGLRPALAVAWDLARISALRCVREEGLGIGVHGVPAIATKEECSNKARCRWGRSTLCRPTDEASLARMVVLL